MGVTVDVTVGVTVGGTTGGAVGGTKGGTVGGFKTLSMSRIPSAEADSLEMDVVNLTKNEAPPMLEMMED